MDIREDVSSFMMHFSKQEQATPYKISQFRQILGDFSDFCLKSEVSSLSALANIFVREYNLKLQSVRQLNAFLQFLDHSAPLIEYNVSMDYHGVVAEYEKAYTEVDQIEQENRVVYVAALLALVLGYDYKALMELRVDDFDVYRGRVSILIGGERETVYCSRDDVQKYKTLVEGIADNLPIRKSYLYKWYGQYVKEGKLHWSFGDLSKLRAKYLRYHGNSDRTLREKGGYMNKKLETGAFIKMPFTPVVYLSEDLRDASEKLEECNQNDGEKKS